MSSRKHGGAGCTVVWTQDQLSRSTLRRLCLLYDEVGQSNKPMGQRSTRVLMRNGCITGNLFSVDSK